jgi:hypothetical protein
VRRAPGVAELAARTRALSAATAPRAAGAGWPGAALPSHALSAAARASIDRQLARPGGSASSVFAGHRDRPERDRGAGASRSAGSPSRSGRSALGPRGGQWTR